MPGAAPRVVIIGHVEWVTHAQGHLPGRGRIADLHDPWCEPAGGGGVAAVAAARLGAHVTLLTALGDDLTAAESRRLLEDRGVSVIAARASGPQTPVLTIIEPGGERTIMVVGARMQARASDLSGTDLLASADAVYYTGEDPELLRVAREARHLVVSGRRLADVAAAGIVVDVIVASANDPDESPAALPGALAPGAVVMTNGAAGGSIERHGAAMRRYAPAVQAAPNVDSYGCGDSFAAGLTVGLARGLGIDDAVAVGAAAGGLCATWRGGLGPR
ncbi:MAG: PfkB family carbohydrate kinase [Thermoleophilia bacterium]